MMLFLSTFRNFMRSCLKWLLLFVVLAGSLQGAADAMVNFKFRIVSARLLSDVHFLTYSKGTEEPPEIVDVIDVGSTISKEYDYKGPAKLNFYKGAITEESKPFATFDLSRLKSGCLFVFWQETPVNAESPGKWNWTALNEIEKRCPNNRIMFFNFTKVPMAAKLGKKVFQPLPPVVESMSIGSKPDDEFQIDVLGLWAERERVISLCRRTMALQRGYRYLGMFFPSPRISREGMPAVDFKLIMDVANVKETQQYLPTEADILW